MITDRDLRAGVASGLITEAQAAGLSNLAHRRADASENLSDADEPFELFRGFNEIFIVVGLLILATGYISVIVMLVSVDPLRFLDRIMYGSAFAGAGVWALSEYFIRRRRMVAPAIALTIMFAGAAAMGFAARFSEPFMVAQDDLTSLRRAIALALVALAVYWFRFRVPFGMALLALGAYVLSLLITVSDFAGPFRTGDLFLLSAGGPFAWVTLALGAAIFALAMVFDCSDPHRVTRRSAQGFWLHIVAAPALVNTLALSLLEQDTTGSNLAMFAVMLIFALVAIIIDRRSFLIGAIGYIVVLAFTVFDDAGSAWTTLGLGVILLTLGAFWAPIRAFLLTRFFFWLPLNRLPPAY